MTWKKVFHLYANSQSQRLRVDGGVAVELGGRVIRFWFSYGSRGHIGELHGLCVSLLDSARDLQPREAELHISQCCVVELGMGGEVADELSRSAWFVSTREVQELVEEGYLCSDLYLKKKKKWEKKM